MLTHLGALAMASCRGLLDSLCQLLTVSECAACGGPAAPRSVFCSLCAHHVELTPEPTRACGLPLVSFARYGGSVAAAVKRLKFANRPDIARPLSHLLRHRVADRGLAPWRDVEVVVPVPLHPTRVVERGYNQALLLARPLARWLGRPLAPRLLQRCRRTRAQTSLSAPERQANLHGAFRPRGRVKARSVLLVDDVVTTGATLHACADALRRGGVNDVRAVTVARSERQGLGSTVCSVTD